MGKVTSSTKIMAARKLVTLNGFSEFQKTISKFPLSIPFTVSSAVGDIAWSKLNNSERIMLAKNVRNNIEYGNIKGIVPINTPKGKSQRYEKKNETVLFKNIFIIANNGYIDSKNKLQFIVNQEQNKVIVVCNYNFINQSADTIELKAEAFLNGKSLFRGVYKKKLGFVGMTQVNDSNKEVPSIQSVWYGFEIIWQNMAQLSNMECNIDEIQFVSTNPQMVERLSGSKVDNTNNIYEYTEYIDNIFHNYLKGNLQEILIPYSIYSIEKRNMDTWMK